MSVQQLGMMADLVASGLPSVNNMSMNGKKHVTAHLMEVCSRTGLKR